MRVSSGMLQAEAPHVDRLPHALHRHRAHLNPVAAAPGAHMTGGQDLPTVGLAAQEDSLVRVTVDGVVQFDGTLKARQRQAWDGAQRIQVWTDKGKTVLIAINGDNLGPYSPSMGKPDWNRIDFGFAPGWVRSDR